MTRSSSRRLTRLLTPAVGLALAATALAGCGGSGGSGGSSGEGESAEEPKVTVLTRAQSEKALLTAENVGTGFKQGDSGGDDEEDGPDLGCLEDFEDEAADAENDADVVWVADNEFETPEVDSSVASAPDVETVDAQFEKLRGFLEKCTSVKATDDDGTTIDLQIASDEDLATEGADDQVTLRATGNISAGGMQIPVFGSYTAMRLDNHAALVGLFELGEEGEVGLDRYAEIALARLEAVAAGKEPAGESAASSGS